jgi:hypothetical protein
MPEQDSGRDFFAFHCVFPSIKAAKRHSGRVKIPHFLIVPAAADRIPHDHAGAVRAPVFLKHPTTPR